MKNALLFSSLLLIGFYSCKKEKDESPLPATSTSSSSPNCFPLSIGSYWIYERFNGDTNGVETTIETDSSYISGDTVIHGDTFAVFVGDVIDSNSVYFRRDSAGYLVDQIGIIRCSNTNFTDTLSSGNSPGYYDYYYKMIPPAIISTPAGPLNAYDYRGTITVLLSGYMWDNPRYIHSYYSDNIGLVRETTFFLMSPNYIGRKLVRYHIQ